MIRQRGNRWQVDVTLEDGQRIRKSFKEKSDAKQYGEELVKRDLLGLKVVDMLPHKSNNHSLEALIDIVYERVWKDTKNGQCAFRNAVMVMDEIGPKMLINEITTLTIDHVVDVFKSNSNSNSTINNKVCALMVCLKYAMKRGWIHQLPYFQRFKCAEGRIRYFSKEEEEQIYKTSNSIGQFDFSGFVNVLIDTGLRTGELTRIVFKDIVFQEGRWLLHVWHRGGIGKAVNTTKNSDMRTVPLTDKAVRIIKAKWRQLSDVELEHCMNDATSAKKLLWDYSRSQIRTQWNNIRNLMDRNDDEEFVPHLCRHTCASRLVQADVPIIAVQKWMGHKTIQITLKYAKTAPKQLYDAIDKLNTKQLSVV